MLMRSLLYYCFCLHGGSKGGTTAGRVALSLWPGLTLLQVNLQVVLWGLPAVWHSCFSSYTHTHAYTCPYSLSCAHALMHTHRNAATSCQCQGCVCISPLSPPGVGDGEGRPDAAASSTKPRKGGGRASSQQGLTHQGWWDGQCELEGSLDP